MRLEIEKGRDLFDPNGFVVKFLDIKVSHPTRTGCRDLLEEALRFKMRNANIDDYELRVDLVGEDIELVFRGRHFRYQ